MTVPFALLAYAVMIAVIGPRILGKSSWPARSPRWGVVAWQALTASILAAVALAGVALAVPTLPWTTNIADLIEACGAALRAQYSTPAGAAASLTGIALSAAVVVRFAYALTCRGASAARARKRQRDALALLARREPHLGVLVVDHPSALAYCVPGRRREVVLTTGALDALDDDELSAVLAHEQAHLRGRHDLVLTWVDGAHTAFPWVGAFRHARAEIAALLEMCADDAATKESQRVTLAAALVQVAEGRAPQAALGAGGATSLARVRRLLSPADPIGRVRGTIVGTLTVALLVAPVAILATPAAATSGSDFCPLAWDSLA